MLFWFSVIKQSFENVFGSRQWSEIHTLPQVLKLNVTLARPLSLANLYFFFNGTSCQMIGACIFMTSNETPRSDLDGLTHTKRLLNLLCIEKFPEVNILTLLQYHPL